MSDFVSTFILLPGIPYKIEVTTGDIRGGGTNAKVYVILHGGKEGAVNSGKLWVQNGQNNFERGKTDLFEVECGVELSPFHHVSVGHDNSGVAPGWFCEKVRCIISCMHISNGILNWTTADIVK